MSDDSLLILKLVLAVFAAWFALLVAVFQFWAIAQDGKHEKAKAWFGAKWSAIGESGLLELPERVIEWLLRAKVKWSGSLINFTDLLGNRNTGLSFLVLFALFVTGCWLYFGTYAGVVALAFVLLASIFMLYGNSDLFDLGAFKPSLLIEWSLRGQPTTYVSSGIWNVTVVWVVGATAGTSAILWILVLLKADVAFAALAMAVMFPAYWITITVVLAPVYLFERLKPRFSRLDDSWTLAALAISTSFTITFLSLTIGHVVIPDAWVPQTLQMLVSNVLLDGVTMLATFAILAWAVARPGFFRIPEAIFADFSIAAVLACLSLYLGLVFTDRAVTFPEVLNVLLFRSPDGNGFEFGPYFWVMHTTFLPTLAYLALIAAAWLSKAFLLPVRWFFGAGREHSNPLALTAAMCAVFAALFGIPAALLQFAG
ncbi:MAG: hypothetical protein BZY80_02945 [SAR202 cluster bacterium Io17-Chloro-G2]|nr:MAG: hypothetical protein BZY80_02945 [SAR202 cluster bacterium Io17-Chloro-G2]